MREALRRGRRAATAENETRAGALCHRLKYRFASSSIAEYERRARHPSEFHHDHPR